MPVLFACSCGKKYSAPNGAAGKRTKCKMCGSSVQIPALHNEDELELTEVVPQKSKSEELFQGPPSSSEERPATQRAGTKEHKPNLVPWLVSLGLLLALAGALKLFLFT